MAPEISKTKTPLAKPNPPSGGGVVPSQKLPPKKSASGAGLWIGIILILIVGGGIAWYFLSKGSQATSAAATGKGSKHGGGGDAIRVVTAKATLGDIGVYLNGLGSVTPLNTVTVRSRVDGQLMKVLFQEGQMVKEGDLLVQIDDRPYKAQVAQFTAQKEHDQALLDNAQIDLMRYQTLWKQDSIPQQQLATQEALVKQDMGTVDSDQAQIDTAQLNVTYCSITAPISGRVGLRLVDQGNQVHASDANGLLVITQVQPITVVFTIPEDSIQPVLDKLHAVQTLTVDAYDRDMKKQLAEGTLLTTDNQIDQTTGTLKLKAAFPNTKNELFPNQFVNTRLLVEMKKDVTLLPVAAIQHGTQGTFVYVVNVVASAADASAPVDASAAPVPVTADSAGAKSADTKPKPSGAVKLQNVTVGTTEGDYVEIQSGVTPGQIVVTDGVDKLQDGSKVILSTPGGGHKKSVDAAADSGN